MHLISNFWQLLPHTWSPDRRGRQLVQTSNCVIKRWLYSLHQMSTEEISVLIDCNSDLQYGSYPQRSLDWSYSIQIRRVLATSFKGTAQTKQCPVFVWERSINSLYFIANITDLGGQVTLSHCTLIYENMLMEKNYLSYLQFPSIALLNTVSVRRTERLSKTGSSVH